MVDGVHTTQPPHVAIIDGGWLGAKGGAGQIMPPMLESLQRAIGDQCAVLASDGCRVIDVRGYSRAVSHSARLRRRLIRGVQEHAPVPILRWLTGTYDVYHYIGLS